MSDKPEHTPLPWYANGKLIVGAMPEDGQIGGCHDVADADFMVLATNAHYLMLAACREAVEITAYAAGCENAGSKPSEVHTKLLAAIRLAEGDTQ